MSDAEPVDVTNLDIYGNAPLEWERARELVVAHTPRATPVFLGTTRPDGRPHAAGIGALWHEGTLYFTASPKSRKARNLVHQPAVTVSMRLPGLDLVLEGVTQRVLDRATLETVAARFHEGGWPAEVDGDALTAEYSAPSAGPPPWNVYRLTVMTAFGVATAEPYGATRWRFAD